MNRVPQDRSGSGQAGFTLLEVLVSLVLLSLLIGALFAGSRSLQQSWTAIRVRDASGEADAAALAVSDWLAQTAGLLELGPDNILRGTFKGRPDALDFVSLGQGRALPAGLVRVSIGLESVSAGTRLAVRYSLFRTEGVPPPIKTAELLSPVERLQLHYFGRDAPNQDPRWRDDWLDRNNLPLLVSIEITSTSSERASVVTAIRLASP